MAAKMLGLYDVAFDLRGTSVGSMFISLDAEYMYPYNLQIQKLRLAVVRFDKVLGGLNINY
uniref:Uncharacterized protein n=1 Tax=Arundo donax TaxID=35708 RepID=A0A0A9G378_ARUDO